MDMGEGVRLCSTWAKKQRRRFYLLKSIIFIKPLEGLRLVLGRLHYHEAAFPRWTLLPAFGGLLRFLHDWRASPLTRCRGLEIQPLLLGRGDNFLGCLGGGARCSRGLLSLWHFCPWGCHAEMEKPQYTMRTQTFLPPLKKRKMKSVFIVYGSLNMFSKFGQEMKCEQKLYVKYSYSTLI